MISKNIGKTHTDLLRLFENMKQMIMAEDGGGLSSNNSFEKEAIEKVRNASFN